jgi:hypothetical protein
MRREKLRNGIIKKSRTRCTYFLSVSSKVNLPSNDSSFKLRRSITSIAKIIYVADIRVRSVLFLTLQVYSDLKHYSSRILFLLHYRIHSLLQSNKKLEALRVLAGKFNFPEDVRKILEWANIRLRQGVESFLDNKLEQLGMLDKDGWMPI